MRRGRTGGVGGRLIYDEGAWGGPAACLRGPFLRPGCIMHRAVPRAREAAQARPGVSGRAGTGMTATGPGRAKTTGHGPGRRAAGCMAKYIQEYIMNSYMDNSEPE